MAQLDPELNIKDPKDFLSYSKGVDVNTQGDSTLGKALTSAGELFSLATKTGDIALKSSIDSELVPSVDSIQNEMGVADASNLKAERDVPPSEIDSSAKFLERNAQAVQQGKLKMSDYWARLESESRRLRARYPGYRDYIDEKMSGMVGSKPANALVRTLHSEAEAAKEKASKNEDKDYSFVLSNFHYLSPEMQSGWKTGLVDNTTAIIAAGRAKGIEQNAQTEATIIGTKAKVGEYNENQAYRSLEGTFAKILDNSIQELPASLGKSTVDLDKYINEVSSGQRVPTPEEKQSLSVFIMGAKKNAETALRSTSSKFFQGIGNGVTGNQAKTEQLIASHLATFDSYNKVLTGDAKGISMITMDKDRAQAEIDSEKVRALRNDLIKRGAVMREYMGDTAYTALMTGQLKSSLERTQHTYMLGGILEGKRSVSDILKDTRAAYAETNPTVEREAIKSTASVLTNKTTPAAKKVDLAQAFFGQDNRRILSEIKPQERLAVMESMTSGQVHNEMEALKKSSPETWSNYKGFVNETLATRGVGILNMLSKEEADAGGKRYYSVQYANGQFVPVRNTDVPLANASEAIAEKTHAVTIGNIAKNLNAHIAPVQRIAKSEGQDPDQVVAGWLKTVGMEKMIPLANVTTKGPSKLGGNLTAEDLAIDPKTGVASAEPPDAETLRRMAEEEANMGTDTATNKVRLDQIRDRRVKALEELRNGIPNFDELFKEIQGRPSS